MKYLEAPNILPTYEPAKSIFLAGSITGAENWQETVTKRLLPHYHIFNPRREYFDVHDKSVEKEQITWEYQHLNIANNLLFWFSYETLAPITLFEYGFYLNKYLQYPLTRFHELGQIFIGIHPEYKRKNDVLIQTRLRSPKIADSIVFDLDELIQKTIDLRH